MGKRDENCYDDGKDDKPCMMLPRNKDDYKWKTYSAKDRGK
jgi:hypothetical protein